MARIEGTASAFAPASKVSATTFSVVGIRSMSLPARAAGNAVGCGPVGPAVVGAALAGPGTGAAGVGAGAGPSLIGH
ncbi:MAG: hypothetical protein AUI14_08610 [Actinobacteria bacterium 13_2_20CM_2_71_6]|nr:MAG: hypothetical protein AUI14_08610 [Actinobacteria bacterium 13_2_20CM_2_71_6]